MTLYTKVNSTPLADANGQTVLGGTMTIVTTDNGDGKSGLPKVYTNALGQPVIDTRDVVDTSEYGSQAPKVSVQATKVNTNTATLHPEGAMETAHVVNKMVMTIDNRPVPAQVATATQPAEEKPVVLKKVGNADVATVAD